MSINQLMQNPEASGIYITIPANSDPVKLADDYLLAKLDSDSNKCLAIECHLRDLARVHFHKPDVLDALKSMERHKARRKLGKGGTKDLKDIGRHVRENYTLGWFTLIDGGRIEFNINGLKIRCLDKPGAVELVACKYERGFKRIGR